MVGEIHSACLCKISETLRRQMHNWLNIPCLDEIHNIGVLMNAAVVHHNYRVRCWKRFHLIQQSLDENEKFWGIKSAFKNIDMEDAFCERECWQDRKSNRQISFLATASDMFEHNVPTATTKEYFPNSLSTPQRPCSAMIWRLTVNGTLVNENKLSWIICPNTRTEFSPLLGTSLNCYLRKLIAPLLSEKFWLQQNEHIFFIEWPERFKILQIVDSSKSTPHVSRISARNSSRYKSGWLLRVEKRCYQKSPWA